MLATPENALTNQIYLHLAHWVWLSAVITSNDPPLTRDGLMFLNIFPLHSHVTVFVCTGDNFKNA